MKIRLYDKEFAHTSSYCGYDKPKYIEWDREGEQSIVLFTERELEEVEKCNSKLKIAWLIEPEAIHDYGYTFIRKNGYKKFNYVITHNQKLINEIPNGVFYPSGGSWIWRKDWSIYPKGKNVSIVASVKDWTDGHRLRQEVINKLADKIDLICGYGRNPVEPKINIFKDYRYSIVIENSKVDYYWTDKLIDVFATGTIPIFWGCPDIGKYFDLNGMYLFDTIKDLNVILEKTGEEDYKNKLLSIEKNFEKAKNFMIVEDYMYETFFKNLKIGDK